MIFQQLRMTINYSILFMIDDLITLIQFLSLYRGTYIGVSASYFVVFTKILKKSLSFTMA